MQEAILSPTAGRRPDRCRLPGGGGAPPTVLPGTPPSFRAALPLLDERSAAILYTRFVCTPAVPVRALADHYRVSPQRIRQVEDLAVRRCLGLWQATAPLLRRASAQLQALAANGYLPAEQRLYARLFGGHDRRLLDAHLAWLESRVLQRTLPLDLWEGTALRMRARHALYRAGRGLEGLRDWDPVALQRIHGIGPLLAAEIYQVLHP
jgi:hypothetical protein